MKGTVFVLFEDFVVETFGSAAYEAVLVAAGRDQDAPFVGPITYPAQDLLSLVDAATAVLDCPPEELLRRFGRSALPRLASSVPDLMSQLPDARAFLTRLESIVHTEVRKLDPEASPARFTVVAEGEDWVDLRYDSPLGLFPLVEGFLDGTGTWFGVSLEHERVAVEGTGAVYRVRFPAPVPAGVRDGE